MDEVTFSYSRRRVGAWIAFFGLWSTSSVGAAVTGSPGSLVLLVLVGPPLPYLVRRFRDPGPAVTLTDAGFVDHRSHEAVVVPWTEVESVSLEWAGRSPWPRMVDISLRGPVPRPSWRDLVLDRPASSEAPFVRFWGALVAPSAPAQARAFRARWEQARPGAAEAR